MSRRTTGHAALSIPIEDIAPPLAVVESTFRDTYVVPLLRRYGYRVYFTWRSDHSPKGFPDICAVRVDLENGGWRHLMFIELKAESGRLTPDQRVWLDDLNIAGAYTYVIRPRHWQALVSAVRDGGWRELHIETSENNKPAPRPRVVRVRQRRSA